MAEYTYTGGSVTGYITYVDVATGVMLVAEPGRSYDLRPAHLEMPMPPDGNWVETTPNKRSTKATRPTTDTTKAGE